MLIEGQFAVARRREALLRAPVRRAPDGLVPARLRVARGDRRRPLPRGRRRSRWPASRRASTCRSQITRARRAQRLGRRRAARKAATPAACRPTARSAWTPTPERHAGALPLRGLGHRPARPLRARHDEEEGAEPGRRVRRQPAPRQGSKRWRGRVAHGRSARCHGRRLFSRQPADAVDGGACRAARPAPDARRPSCLAGGATLVAMMNARVLEPSRAGQPGRHRRDRRASRRGRRRRAHRRLHAASRDGRLRRCLRGSAAVVRHAAAQIANATVRNMGTIGGSIAFADPGARLSAGAGRGRRRDRDRRRCRAAARVAAADFFVDWYTTALEPGELVTAVLLPAPRPRRRRLHQARARRRRLRHRLGGAPACDARTARVRVAIGACGPTPLRRRRGRRAAVRATAATPRSPQRRRSCSPQPPIPLDDVRGSADYRRLLIPAPAAARGARGRSAHRSAA